MTDRILDPREIAIRDIRRTLTDIEMELHVRYPTEVDETEVSRLLTILSEQHAKLMVDKP